MFLLDWLQRYYEIKAENKRLQRENDVNEANEILKHELEVVRLENQRLLDRILEKPKEEVKPDITDLKPVTPMHLPWRVRQQMLEAEDRDRAKKLKQVQTEKVEASVEFKTEATTDKPMSVEALEKELGVEENAG